MWHCDYCGSANKDERESCHGCGARNPLYVEVVSPSEPLPLLALDEKEWGEVGMYGFWQKLHSKDHEAHITIERPDYPDHLRVDVIMALDNKRYSKEVLFFYDIYENRSLLPESLSRVAEDLGFQVDSQKIASRLRFLWGMV